jgi:hypothetical protein
MGGTRKVSDHHLRHEWQWLAAISPHWIHHPSTADVDKYINDLLKFSGKQL